MATTSNMPDFGPLPRKPAGTKKSNIMKKSRKELQTTQAHMKMVPPPMSDISCSVKAVGSTPMLYHSEGNKVQHSGVIRIGAPPPSEKRIMNSKMSQFKAMEGLVHKENNFRAANNKYKTRPSGVKERSKANLGHDSVAIDDKVKKLDCMTNGKFPSRTFGKELSNNQMELKDKTSNFGYPTKPVNAKTNSHKRCIESLLLDKNIESLLDHKTIGNDHVEDGVQVDNVTCTHMKKRRRRKLILDDDDDVDAEATNCFGDLMAINSSSKGSMHVEQISYCCSKPIDEPTWRGIFKIGQKYLSLAGHLSTKYGEKVWKLSRSLLPIVEVTKLSRSKAWPRKWNASKPNGDNIGLYFLPHEMRENEEMDQLLKEVIENDLALRAIIGEAEMLIFHSILLLEQYQTFKGKHYLWGVFKRREHEGVVVTGPLLDVVGCRAQKGVEIETKDFSITPDEEPHEKQYHETMFMKADIPSENQDRHGKNTYGVQAIMGFESKVLEEERHGDALPHAICSGEAVVNATVGDILYANHTQIDQSRRLPSGKVFGFVVGQTPRLLQLIHEMEREGGVVIAMQGEMLGASIVK